MDNKYRVHEVAKDFKLNGKAVGSKKVMEILTKYAQTPSSHMAVLSDLELSIVFDYLTQNNQIKDLEEVFSETYHEPKGQNQNRQGGAQNQGQNRKGDQNRRGRQGDRRNDSRGGQGGRGDQNRRGQGGGNRGGQQQSGQ